MRCGSPAAVAYELWTIQRQVPTAARLIVPPIRQPLSVGLQSGADSLDAIDFEAEGHAHAQPRLQLRLHELVALDGVPSRSVEILVAGLERILTGVGLRRSRAVAVRPLSGHHVCLK